MELGIILAARLIDMALRGGIHAQFARESLTELETMIRDGITPEKLKSLSDRVDAKREELDRLVGANPAPSTPEALGDPRDQ